MLMLINCGIDVVEPRDELPIIRKEIRVNLVILTDDSGILQGRRMLSMVFFPPIKRLAIESLCE